MAWFVSSVICGAVLTTLASSSSATSSWCTTTAEANALLSLQWSNAALLEFIFPPTGTNVSGPSGAFAYTTSSAAACLWNAGAEPPLSLSSSSSSTSTAPAATWNSSFTEWDDAFVSVWNFSSLDGVVGTHGDANMSLVSPSATMLLPSELCLATPTTALNNSSSCIASVTTSTFRGCLLDPDNVITASSPSAPSTANVFAEYLQTVVSQRSLARRWFSGSVDFLTEAQQAYSSYLRGVASIASTSSPSNLTSSEGDLMLRAIVAALQPLLAAHVDATVTPKWLWIESTLVAASNKAFVAAAAGASGSSTTTTSDCPTVFVSSWKTASSVSMGVSIVEAALGTAVSLLLASQSEAQVRTRCQCVLETYAVARWLEEDYPALVVTATPGQQQSGWSSSTLLILANLQLSANTERLANIIATRLTFSALMSMFTFMATSMTTATTPIQLVAQCLADWYSNISSTTAVPATSWGDSASSGATAPMLSWLRSQPSKGISRCFALQTSATSAVGHSGRDQNELIQDTEWTLDVTNESSHTLFVFEQVVPGSATTPGAIRASIAATSVPRLPVTTTTTATVVFTFMIPPTMLVVSDAATIDAVVAATVAIRSYGLPLASGSSPLYGEVFAPSNAPVLERRPMASAPVTPSPVYSFIWNDTVQGSPATSSSCGPGFLQLRDYDTNATICEQCRNEPSATSSAIPPSSDSIIFSSSYLFCTGDGYARACVNKPGGVGNDNISAYVPQGSGQLSTSNCPFYCRSYYQYRNGSRCVSVATGNYASSNTTQDSCEPHSVLAARNVVITTAASAGGNRSVLTADFTKWSAFVSPGAFSSSKSCAYATQRRIISERFDLTTTSTAGNNNSNGGKALASTLLWCNRSAQVSGIRGSPSPPMGIQLRLQGRYNPAGILAAHRTAGVTRLAFQLAEVFGDNETMSQGYEDVGGGWSWYLVTTLDAVDAVNPPSTISMQMWFNASFIAAGNPEAFAAAPHSLLFFSYNRTISWSDFATTTTPKVLSAAVSVNLESGLLSFSLNGCILGPLQSIPWTTSLAQATCRDLIASPSSSTQAGGKFLRLAVGGWLASFSTALGPVATRLGMSDELPNIFYFFPMNMTKVGFSGVPFGADQLLTGPLCKKRAYGVSGATTADENNVWSYVVALPSSNGTTNSSTNRCSSSSSSVLALRPVLNDGTAFATTPPNRINHVVYLNALTALFQQSNTSWSGGCRGGYYSTSTTATSMSSASCNLCPIGSVWQATAANTTVSAPMSAAASCVCISTRAFVSGTTTCVPLAVAYHAPIFVENTTTTPSIPDGTQLRLNSNSRARLLLFTVAMNATLQQAASSQSLALNGSLSLTVNCTSTAAFGVPLTDIVLDCTSPIATQCAVYVTTSVDFSSSSSSSLFKGDSCRITITTTQLYRYPSPTISRTYTFWPKAPPVEAGTVNFINGSILPDATANITIAIQNYSFFSAASTFLLAQAAKALSSSESSLSFTPNDLQAMTIAATSSSQVVVTLSLHTVAPPLWSGSTPSTSTLVPLTSPAMFVFPASTASRGMRIDLSASTALSLFHGNVAVLNLSVTSSAGFFAPSDTIMMFAVSEAYQQQLLAPEPNAAADALSKPLVLTLSLLTLILTSAALAWTIHRRPPHFLKKIVSCRCCRCEAHEAHTSASSSASSDGDEEYDEEEESEESDEDDDDGTPFSEPEDVCVAEPFAPSPPRGPASTAPSEMVEIRSATTLHAAASSTHNDRSNQSSTQLHGESHSPFASHHRHSNRRRGAAGHITAQFEQHNQPQRHSDGASLASVHMAHIEEESARSGPSGATEGGQIAFYNDAYVATASINNDVSFDRSQAGFLGPRPTHHDVLLAARTSGSIDHELTNSAKSRWRRSVLYDGQQGTSGTQHVLSAGNVAVGVDHQQRRQLQSAATNSPGASAPVATAPPPSVLTSSSGTSSSGNVSQMTRTTDRNQRNPSRAKAASTSAVNSNQRDTPPPRATSVVAPPAVVHNKRPWKTAAPLPPPFDR